MLTVRGACYKYVDNKAQHSETQHVNKTDFIFDVSGIDRSLGKKATKNMDPSFNLRKRKLVLNTRGEKVPSLKILRFTMFSRFTFEQLQ